MYHDKKRQSVLAVYSNRVKSESSLSTDPKTVTFACYDLCLYSTKKHVHINIWYIVQLSTHHVLEPVRVKVRLDALYLALVSMPPGSLPWLGSVKPKQPRSSPCAAKSETPQDRNNTQSTHCPKSKTLNSLNWQGANKSHLPHQHRTSADSNIKTACFVIISILLSMKDCVCCEILLITTQWLSQYLIGASVLRDCVWVAVLPSLGRYFSFCSSVP